MRRNWTVSAGDLILVVIPLLALFPLHNNDLWWHLATGRWMVDHGTVPHSDPFSWTRYLEHWVDNEWLSEFLFYGVWRLGGAPALIALRAALYLAVALALRAYLTALGRPRVFPASLAVAVALSHHWWELRPSVFSLLLLLLLLLAVERRRFRFVPPLFLLWANLHPGFLLGIVVLAAMTTALFIGRLTPGWRQPGLRARTLIATLLTSGAATLVNPYGWRVYEQQFSIAGNRAYRMQLDEWLVPSPAILVTVCVALLLAVASVRRVPLERLAAFFAGATIAMTAVRFVEYFAWISVPILLTFPLLRKRRFVAEAAAIVIAVALAWFPPSINAQERQSEFYGATARRARAAAVVTAAIALAALASRRRMPRLAFGPALAAGGLLAAVAVGAMPPGGTVEPRRYPVGCLRLVPADARIYNRLSFGGWILWTRSIPVFIDGRCSGQPLFFEYVAAQVRYARAVLDRRSVGWVVVAPEDPIVPQLAEAPGWERVCEEPAAVVFRRKSLSVREFSP